jgi:homoserine kinase type II
VAVYTDVSEEELGAFLAGYDLGALLSYKGIAEGVENTNYLLQTGTGHYILTLYEKRVARDELPFFIGLMEHLATRGINCPQPVKSRAGTALGELAGKPAAIVTFLEGVSVRRPNVVQCAAVGRALAELHLAGRDFKLHRKNALSLPGWQALAEAAGARADNVTPGLAAIIGNELEFLSHHWPAELPRGVIHADLFPDNVFFLGDKLTGIIDFYFACNDFLAFDLAICLNAWCFEIDGSFNVTKGKAILSGYVAVRTMFGEELYALPLMARGASLRFLLTRLVDWLDVPPGALVRPKDPNEYLKKLRFHQRIGHARDYGLAA